MKTRTDVTRTRTWREVTRRLRAVTDGNGMPIDAGIVKTCVILNVLGFTTQMSCEGHLDHSLPYPWVRLISVEAEAFYAHARACTERASVLGQEPATYAEAVQRQAILDEARMWREQAWRALAADGSRLFAYMQQFYEMHLAAQDRQLILITDVSLGYVQIASQGGPLLLAMPEESRPPLLLAYQQEMQAFTAFLVDRYRQMVQ